MIPSLSEYGRGRNAPFRAEDEERLRRGHVLHGGIPHHHPLGRSEAGNVGVQCRALLAGLHLKHALRRDVHSRAMHHPLDLCHQIAMMIAERLELVEHRLDPNRRDEKDQDHDGNQSQPEIEPPATRTAAQRSVENPASKVTNTNPSSRLLPQSPNHDPQRCTDSP